MTGVADVEWITKRQYKNGLKKDALTSKNALLRHVTHEETFTSNESGTKGGIYISTPTNNGQGIGGTSAGAYANRAGAKGTQFVVPQRVKRYYGELTDVVLMNAMHGGSESQLIDGVTHDIDSATEAFGQELNGDLYRANNAIRAYGTFSGSTITLTDAAGNATPEAASLFEIDMTLQFVNPADNSLRDSGDTLTVTGVDFLLGTVTTSAALSNISGLTTLDGIVRSSTVLTSYDGLSGWAPETASASFLGVNQAIAKGRHCGVYYDISGFGVREGFIRGFSKFEQALGNNFDEKAPIFMNPADVAEIVASVEAIKCVEGEEATSYNTGLKTVTVLGYKLVKDRHAPVGRAFLVPKGAFTLGTCGPMAQLFEANKGEKFRYLDQTGVLSFSMLSIGNSYSRNCAALGQLKLATRTL